jgi:sugar phosphate isomerase/epimerase
MIEPHRSTRREFLGQAAGCAAVGVLTSCLARAGGESPEKQGREAWEIGIYTRPWAAHDYRVAFDAMAAAGFKYAGLMTAKGKSGLVLSTGTTSEEAHRVGEEARSRGLKINSVYGGGFPVRKNDLRPGIEGLEKLLDNTAAAGGTSLLLGGIGDAELQTPYYKIAAECCGYAAEKGLWMVVKPHGGLNATGSQCRKCIAQVSRKNFALWYDPGNIFYYSAGKLDPVSDAATVDGIVRGMSVKDYKAPLKVDVTPGAGQVNFPAVMARLKKGGFTSGPLVIECLAPGDLGFLLAEAKKARQFVEDLVRAG